MEKIRIFVENVFSGLPKTKEVIDMKRDIQNNMEEHYLDLIRQGKDEDTAFGIVIGEFGSIEDIRHELNLDELLYNENDLPLESDSPLYQAFEKKFRNGIIAGVACCIIGAFGSGILSEIFGNTHFSDAIQMTWFAIFVCLGVVLFIYWGMEKERFNKNSGFINHDETYMETSKKKNKKTKNIINGLLWQMTVLAYLMMGFFLDLWHPGWIIFIISGIISSIVNFLF